MGGSIEGSIVGANLMSYEGTVLINNEVLRVWSCVIIIGYCKQIIMTCKGGTSTTLR